MKNLIALCVLLSTFINAAEIYSKDNADPNFIKIMETGKSQYSFVSCKVADPNNCSWIGKKDFYSERELAVMIKDLTKKGSFMLTSEIVVVTGVTAAAWYAAGQLGAVSVLAAFMGIFTGNMGGPAIISGLGAVVLAVGVPTAGIMASTKIQVLNPTYPKKLAQAVQAIIDGDNRVNIKVESIDYIADLLGTTLDK